MAKTKRAGGRGGWRQWSEAQAAEVLAELRASGESTAKFAARCGVSTQRLSYWAKRLPAGQRQPAFVPVELSAGRDDGALIELAAGDVVIRVREGADLATLRRVVDALRGGASC
jgi:hypothetical protein